MKKTALLVCMAVVLVGCGAPLVGNKGTPDETMVVDAPPLTLPPRFDLRPPREGEDAAEDLLRNQPATAIEKEDSWLIEKAGRIDSDIRNKLDPKVETPKEDVKKEEEFKEKGSTKAGWWQFWAEDDEASSK